MLNNTILSLHILSMTSTSSFLLINQHYNGLYKTMIFNSHFSHFFPNVVLTYANSHRTFVWNTKFTNSLDTPLRFESLSCAISKDPSQSKIPMPLEDKTIQHDDFIGITEYHAYFTGDCGDLIDIRFCRFQSLHSIDTNGGSLLISQDCVVFIHGTTFDDSYCRQNRGAGACIVKSFLTVDDANISDGKLTSLNVQYCCFSRCFSRGEEEDKLYGTALFCAAKDTVLYYSSSVECPPKTHDQPIKRSAGAQFDIQADNVKSKNMNVTGGKSKYCSGIEYRKAKYGFFRFQTISNIEECMFATSLTGINGKSLEISYCTYFNNRLINSAIETDIYLLPGLILIRFCDVIIQNFCFCKFNDGSTKKNAKLVSRGTEYVEDEKKNLEQHNKITFINCYRDSSISTEQIGVVEINGTDMLFGDVILDESGRTIENQLLSLGKCEGVVPPQGDVGKTLDVEPVFEPTDEFTLSKMFSFSFDFSYSVYFSSSDRFSVTNQFSKSNLFSQSTAFPKSNAFTFSFDFTVSKIFSSSDAFSKTSYFTMTKGFSETDDFTISSTFLPTVDFNHTHSFSPSNTFSNSLFFSNSFEFSDSNEFTNSIKFSKSDNFLQTVAFTCSSEFSKTFYFSLTKQFSNSNMFTINNEFSPSLYFTPSKKHT